MCGCVALSGIGSFVAYDRTKKKLRTPPGPIPQYINKFLHTEPFSFIFYGIFWSGVLIIVYPVVGILLLIISMLKVIKYLHSPKAKVVDAKNGDKELAVYITGCDSGFGKDLAFALYDKGFIVFPGCLSEDGMKQFEGMANMFPIKVDVTKDEHTNEAATYISKWLQQPSSKKQRVLHCIVNNAGIGNLGLIDWLDLSTFRKVMDVNCFGTIRTVKSFFPIFKKQVFEKSHPEARIVNVTSLAGLMSNTGACAYSSSKHAAEAFTACLRLELQAFNIPVVSVNPSWHQTPLSDSTGAKLDDVWNDLSPEVQEEYGKEYFSSFSENFLKKKKLEWSAKVVETELVSCVEAINPPPQVIVGSDAKYPAMVFRLLPVWLQLKILDYASPVKKAAKMG